MKRFHRGAVTAPLVFGNGESGRRTVEYESGGEAADGKQREVSHDGGAAVGQWWQEAHGRRMRWRRQRWESGRKGAADLQRRGVGAPAASE